MEAGRFLAFEDDIFALILSGTVLAAYHAFVHYQLKRDPLYTIQAVNALARSAWVESIMASGNKEVLAVQTLRNSIMGPTFLASTAVLLIIGVLSLSVQGGRFGPGAQALSLTKLILLLLDFFAAFFFFSVAIRLFIHVGYLINVPLSASNETISPRRVAMLLNRAGSYHTLGMRAYYFSVPLVFWLFGPAFLLIATLLLVVALFHLDRTPGVAAIDHR
jgi:uncharacterized membrane protein